MAIVGTPDGISAVKNEIFIETDDRERGSRNPANASQAYLHRKELNGCVYGIR